MPTMDCQLLLAQTNPLLGALGANLEQHLAQIDRAIAAGAQLVLFPELSLSGYFLKDQTYEVGLGLESAPVAALLERSRRISICFGFVERSRDGRLYNAQAFLEDGKLLGVHRKVHLVTYGMFDERRDLAAGEHFDLIESKHGRFGILICEDMWHLGGTYLHFLNHADAILVPSASPGRGVGADGEGLSSVRVWNTLLAANALFTQTWMVYCNRVGFEDGIGFSGSSSVHDPFGKRVALIEGFDPGELLVRIDSQELNRARAFTPLRRDERPWLLANELWRLQGHERKPRGEA